MESLLTISEIDKFGNKLKKLDALPCLEEIDHQLLNEFRNSFFEIQNLISEALKSLSIEFTPRAGKTTKSIIKKLKRTNYKLTQIQDIVGCRIIVDSITEQEQLIQKIIDTLNQDRCKLVDRRINPIHGYRAVHIIYNNNNQSYEIQLRTQLQDSWAKISEAFSDKIDEDIKYGKGNLEIIKILNKLSQIIEQDEIKEYNTILGRSLSITFFIKSLEHLIENYYKDPKNSEIDTLFLNALNKIVLNYSNQELGEM
jgi:putative GTP pyrophosphokinase